MKEHADIAQQVERILGKDEVPGSNPGISSIRLAEMQVFFVVIREIMQDGAGSSCIVFNLIASFAICVTKSVTFRAAKEPCKSVITTDCGLQDVSHNVSHRRLQAIHRRDSLRRHFLCPSSLDVVFKRHCWCSVSRR